MSDDTVPVIDIGPFLAGDPAGREAIPQVIARACEGIGFFTVVEVACIPTCADASHPPRYPLAEAGPYRCDKYAQASIKPTAA